MTGGRVIMKIMPPIVDDVRTSGDKAVLSYTQTFEKTTSLTSSVIRAPFPESMVQLPAETMAVDTLFENISKFHAAQKEEELLMVDTMLDMVCRRFVRPIKPVGFRVPGGAAGRAKRHTAAPVETVGKQGQKQA